ncbi:MAG: photosystem II biogenesis protein Psp29 [Nodosilinea sp.]
MNNAPVRTVSDAKRDFYTHHTRPINSIYRRVVDELMVEMHLLSVNVDFAYDPIYALGIVTTFDRFMVGYQPENDKTSIFSALCQSINSTAEHYRGDAEAIKASANGMSLDDLKGQFENLSDGGEGLRGTLASIANKEKFKYSRPFGVGLYTLVEAAAPAEGLKEKDTVEALFKELGSKLNIVTDKLLKDVDLYRSNLEKFAQAQEVMKDMLAADRKKREERQKAAEAAAEAIAESVDTAPKAAESGEAAESEEATQ